MQFDTATTARYPAWHAAPFPACGALYRLWFALAKDDEVVP
jgi:hypothetical protein